MLVFCEHKNGCLAHAIDFKQGCYLCAAHYQEVYGEPSPNLALTQAGCTGFSKEQLAQIYFERLQSQISAEEQRELEMSDQVLDYEQSFRLRQPPPKFWYNQD